MNAAHQPARAGSGFLKGAKAVIGMIHVAALPGTPRYAGAFREIISKAKHEATIYREAGVDMLAVENMHDAPYLRAEVGPEITAAMAVLGHEVKNAAGLRCGLQILAGANQAALGAALAADLDFVRVEGFVFAHVADEGLFQSDAGRLMRYRKKIGAEHIPVLTDIKKKHGSHALTADISIEETARAAEFFTSDGVIVTGGATGQPANPAEVARVSEAVRIPVLVGSGVTHENVTEFLPHADALIVGSHFKKNGYWMNAVDPTRVRVFMDIVRQWREQAGSVLGE